AAPGWAELQLPSQRITLARGSRANSTWPTAGESSVAGRAACLVGTRPRASALPSVTAPDEPMGALDLTRPSSRRVTTRTTRKGPVCLGGRRLRESTAQQNDRRRF